MFNVLVTMKLLWLSARAKTNNTAELSAIGEAMLWLQNEAPNDGDVQVERRYDSKYGANMATGRWDPKSNEELAEKVREIVEEVEARRNITWMNC